MPVIADPTRTREADILNVPTRPNRLDQISVVNAPTSPPRVNIDTTRPNWVV